MPMLSGHVTKCCLRPREHRRETSTLILKRTLTDERDDGLQLPGAQALIESETHEIERHFARWGVFSIGECFVG